MKEETKKKLSEALKRFCSQEGFVSWHKGKKRSEETKRKISEANKIACKGRKPSEKMIRAGILARTGKPLSKETRAKISLANTGKHPTEETRRKMSMSSGSRGRIPWNKGIACTEELKQKVSDSVTKTYLNGRIPWNKGKGGYHIHSKEHKKGLSESMKGNKFGIGIVPWNKGIPLPTEVKKKISEATKGEKHRNFGRHLSEETRKKIGNAHKGEKSWHWKGGRSLTYARVKHRRRKLGFIPLNDKEEVTWEAHHLDEQYILFIPNRLHKSIPHKLSDIKSMDKINNIVIEWYIKYYGL